MSTYIRKGLKNSPTQQLRVRDLDISIDQATRAELLPYRMRHFRGSQSSGLSLPLAWAERAAERDRVRNGEGEGEREDYKKFGYLSGRIMGNDMSGGFGLLTT